MLHVSAVTLRRVALSDNVNCYSNTKSEVDIMEKETECPCTRSCPLRGDCVKCYTHEMSINDVPYCMVPEMNVSKAFEEKIRAGLLAAGIRLDGCIKTECSSL